ncbi:MAG: kelch repeat-containing protein [Bdellovibrionales bacterium]
MRYVGLLFSLALVGCTEIGGGFKNVQDSIANRGAQLIVEDSSVTEGEAALVTVTLTEPSAENIEFEWSTVDGSAVQGSDYMPQNSMKTVIPAGATSVQISIPTMSDGPDDGESFSVVVNNVSQISTLDSNGVITIRDPVVVELAIEPRTLDLNSGKSWSFSGVGGLAPYTFAVVSGSGAINASGVYSSSASGDDTVTIEITDADGDKDTATINVTDASFTGQICSGNISADSGNIYDSGGQSGNYSADESCYTRVRSPSSLSLIFDFTSLSLGSGDSLEILDSDSWASLATYNAGSSLPSQLVLPSDVYLYFSSDSADEQSGFEISFSTDNTLDLLVANSATELEAGWPINLSAVGGVGPYEFTVASGSGSVSLNSGQLASAEYTGTMIAQSVSLRVTDANNISVSKSIVVVDNALAFTSSSLSTGDPGNTTNIYGTGFQPDMKVYVGTTECSNTTIYSPTYARCTIPSGSGVVGIKLYNSPGEQIYTPNVFSYRVGTWTDFASQPSNTGYRRGLANVWTGRYLLLWGGNDGSSSYGFGNYKDGFVYDNLTATWSSMATSPLDKKAGTAHVWTGTEMIIYGGLVNGNLARAEGGAYDPVNNTWRMIATPPSTSYLHGRAAIWTGKEMYVVGGKWNSVVRTVHSYNPTTDSWRSIQNMPGARYWHDLVWTGERLITFGGRWGSGSGEYSNTGYIYNPQTNSWATLSPSDMKQRFSSDYANVGTYLSWTGEDMIVTGGGSSGTGVADKKYNPATDTWTDIASFPSYSSYMSRVIWTGSHVVYHYGANNAAYDYKADVWLGVSSPTTRNYGSGAFVYTGSEALQCFGSSKTSDFCESLDLTSLNNPLTNMAKNSWLDIDSSSYFPRKNHSLDWTGSHALAFGGQDSSGSYLESLVKYDPLENSWDSIVVSGSPAARALHSSIWTGTKLFVFGGKSTSGALSDGHVFDYSNSSWSTISNTNSPSARYDFKMIQLDHRLLVWGGNNGTTQLNDGAIYNTETDSWTAISSSGATLADADTQVVYNGSDVFFFGGANSNGVIYNPDSDTWSSASSSNSPGVLTGFSLIASGEKMLVFGGENSSSSIINDAWWYTPSTNTWDSVTEVKPSARKNHSTIWTGNRLLIYGGETSSGAVSSGVSWDPNRGIVDSFNSTNEQEAGTPKLLWTGSVGSKDSIQRRLNFTGDTSVLMFLGGTKAGGLLSNGKIFKPTSF